MSIIYDSSQANHEPRLARGVFKILGSVCKRFLPSSPPPPSLIFCSRPIFRAPNCSRPIFRAAKTSKCRSSDFFALRTHGNACCVGYKAASSRQISSCVWDAMSFKSGMSSRLVIEKTIAMVEIVDW